MLQVYYLVVQVLILVLYYGKAGCPHKMTDTQSRHRKQLMTDLTRYSCRAQNFVTFLSNLVVHVFTFIGGAKRRCTPSASRPCVLCVRESCEGRLHPGRHDSLQQEFLEPGEGRRRHPPFSPKSTTNFYFLFFLFSFIGAVRGAATHNDA